MHYFVYLRTKVGQGVPANKQIMRLFLNVAIGLLVLTGCKKDPPNPAPEPCNDEFYDCDRDTLNILWIDTLTTDLFETIPIIKVGNSIIHSYRIADRLSALQSRNIYSGEVEWESGSIPRNIGDDETSSFSNSRYVFINAMRSHHAIDLNNGQETWRFDTEYGEVTSFLIDEYYITSNSSSCLDAHSVDVLVCDAKIRSQCDLAFREYATDDQEGVEVRAHSAYIDASGDLILIIGINRYRYPDNWFDLKCYNYSQDSLVWEVLGVGEDERFAGLLSMSGYPKVDLENNRVYVMDIRTLYCYDLITGQEVWRSNGTPSSNYILYGEKVVWVDSDWHATAVNKHTGELIYRENIDGIPDRIEPWGHKCIIATGDLRLMDLNTGKILHNKGWWLPYYGGGSSYTTPLIDEANNRMYLTDGYAIICAEIPVEWKE